VIGCNLAESPNVDRLIGKCALRGFDLGGRANIDIYDTKRKAAWKNIQEILGISD
jgi:hypothetical protein